VIERLRNLSRPRRHPRSRVFSRYLDGDLDIHERHELEAHVRDCARCRRLVASLETTVRALGSLRTESPTRVGVGDAIIGALRAESGSEIDAPGRSSPQSDEPALALLPGSSQPSTPSGWPRRGLAALRYCLRRPQLRLTLPIALLAGVVLSFVNQGGMLLDGRIDLGMCAMCALDFLVPFIALNIGLLMVLRAPRRRRTLR
jgi:anti-sigma factor RsiW